MFWEGDKFCPPLKWIQKGNLEVNNKMKCDLKSLNIYFIQNTLYIVHIK